MSYIYIYIYSQCDLSETIDVVVENEKLKKDMADLKQQSERTAEVRNKADFNIR